MAVVHGKQTIAVTGHIHGCGSRKPDNRCSVTGHIHGCGSRKPDNHCSVTGHIHGCGSRKPIAVTGHIHGCGSRKLDNRCNRLHTWLSVSAATPSLLANTCFLSRLEHTHHATCTLSLCAACCCCFVENWSNKTTASTSDPLLVLFPVYADFNQ